MIIDFRTSLYAHLIFASGVLSALKNLQQKIKQIEREKQQAEQNLQNLKCDALPTDDSHVKQSANISSGLLRDTTVASGSVVELEA
jgi:hypothetical protein